MVAEDCLIMPPGCGEVKFVWVIGGYDTYLPDGVGLPIGEGNPWFAMQVSYYKTSEEGVVDSSGLRLYLSDALLAEDASYLEMSAGDQDWLQGGIPPGEDNYEASMFVPSSTTMQWASQINVINVFQHMHTLGNRIVVDVYRGGEYLGPLYNEPVHGWLHLATFPSSIPHLEPGDEIRLRCTYGTPRRTLPTRFGDYEGAEMCYANIMYYPRQLAGDGWLDATETPNDLPKPPVCQPKGSLSVDFSAPSPVTPPSDVEIPSSDAAPVTPQSDAETPSSNAAVNSVGAIGTIVAMSHFLQI